MTWTITCLKRKCKYVFAYDESDLFRYKGMKCVQCPRCGLAIRHREA